jgi:hypothetical protein
MHAYTLQGTVCDRATSSRDGTRARASTDTNHDTNDARTLQRREARESPPSMSSLINRMQQVQRSPSHEEVRSCPLPRLDLNSSSQTNDARTPLRREARESVPSFTPAQRSPLSPAVLPPSPFTQQPNDVRSSLSLLDLDSSAHTRIASPRRTRLGRWPPLMSRTHFRASNGQVTLFMWM